jgi:hypothetical protein
MKKLALIVLTLCVPVLAWAATPAGLAASPQWIGTAHDSVFALARRGDELWAATNFGLLLKRHSEPQWQTAYETHGAAVLAIGFSPQGNGVAAGQSGLLLEVPPNSTQWKADNTGVKHRLMWVASNSRGDFLVVGAFGTVLYRPAGGTQWQKLAVPSSEGEEPHLYGAIFVSDDEALIVGENETLIDFDKGKIAQKVELGQPPKSAKPSGSDQGSEQSQEVVTPSLFAVTYCDGMLVAAGQRGLVLTKTLAAESKATPKTGREAGKHAKAEQATGLLAGWQSSEIKGQHDVYGLVCTPTGALVGVSNNGAMVSGTRQANGGINWQVLYAKGLYAPWLSAALPAGDDDFLVAGPGTIWEVSSSNGK